MPGRIRREDTAAMGRFNDNQCPSRRCRRAMYVPLRATSIPAFSGNQAEKRALPTTARIKIEDPGTAPQAVQTNLSDHSLTTQTRSHCGDANLYGHTRLTTPRGNQHDS
jgi:hypothetical protein